MSEVTCAVCCEPWEWYGIRHGDFAPAERARFLEGDGCPSCEWGASCPRCSGTGKAARFCEYCLGPGELTIERTAQDPVWRTWHGPWTGDTRGRDWPGRDTGAGHVYQRRVPCPECAAITRPACPECDGSGLPRPLSGESVRMFLASLGDATDGPEAEIVAPRLAAKLARLAGGAEAAQA